MADAAREFAKRVVVCTTLCAVVKYGYPVLMVSGQQLLLLLLLRVIIHFHVTQCVVATTDISY